MAKNISTIILKYNAKIAEPIIEVTSNSEPINITNNSLEGEYIFYIRNYNENKKISDVSLDYTIELLDTIKEESKKYIKYELYKNGDLVELQNQKTNIMRLGNKNLQEDKYVLKIKYDKNASETMEDIWDNINIKVHSQQIKT